MNEIAILPATDSRTSYRPLSDAIEALPTVQRTVLALFYFERLALAEIAEILEEEEDGVAAEFYLAHAALGLVPDAVTGLEACRQVA